MRSSRLVLWTIASASAFLILLAWGGEENAIQQLAERNLRVDEKLNEFDIHKNPKSLKDAYTLISSAPFDRSSQDWRDVCGGIMETTLRILEECYEARDHEYDIADHRPFYTQVCPPLGGEQIIVSGMDPKEVKDPEVRKLYEQAIVENNRRKAEYRREKALQDILDRGILHIQECVEALPSDAERGDAIIAIKKSVKNGMLRERILQRVEKNVGSSL